MNKIVRPFALVLFAAVPLVAGAQVHDHNGFGAGASQGHDGRAALHSVNGYGFGLVGPGAVLAGCGVTDMDTFNMMIAAKPTPAKFRELYSCVQLVLPGSVGSVLEKNVRSDNSRFVAELDQYGHIVGGSFR